MGYEDDKAALNGREPYYGPGGEGMPYMDTGTKIFLMSLILTLILASIFCDSEEQLAKEQAIKDQFIDYGY